MLIDVALHTIFLALDLNQNVDPANFEYVRHIKIEKS